MHRSKKKRNIIIISLVGVLFLMGIGYAAFNTELKISGTSKVTSNWDIEITNVTPGTPTGSAENTVAPKWDALTASMEADLYEKGDAMEYDVTIENKGTIDAKLNNILTNLENSNSEAVNITFSGYTKGEVLKAGSIKIIHVKIEYNPNYEGGETSSEVEIDFDYGQENNNPEAPKSYLLTYDYSSNGGTNADIKEEYVTSKDKVNLNNKAYKEGYTFVGWNIDKDAKEGLTEYEMPESSVTLYAIYSKEIKVTYTTGSNITNIGKTNDTCTMYNNETTCEITLPTITPNNGYMVDGWYNGNSKIGIPNDKYKISSDITLSSKVIEDVVSLTISTTSTTNSITVVANASATSGISKYEYSKDGGKTWVTGTGNTHTFTGLTQGTSYNIMVRITSNAGKGTNQTKATTTSTLTKPTFSESGTSPKTVTITYPSGCGSTLTCTYQKDNGSAVTVKSTTASVEFTASGSVVANVSDGTNTVSSSYTVEIKVYNYILYRYNHNSGAPVDWKISEFTKGSGQISALSSLGDNEYYYLIYAVNDIANNTYTIYRYNHNSSAPVDWKTSVFTSGTGQVSAISSVGNGTYYYIDYAVNDIANNTYTIYRYNHNSGAPVDWKTSVFTSGTGQVSSLEYSNITISGLIRGYDLNYAVNNVTNNTYTIYKYNHSSSAPVDWKTSTFASGQGKATSISYTGNATYYYIDYAVNDIANNTYTIYRYNHNSGAPVDWKTSVFTSGTGQVSSLEYSNVTISGTVRGYDLNYIVNNPANNTYTIYKYNHSSSAPVDWKTSVFTSGQGEATSISFTGNSSYYYIDYGVNNY